MLCTKSVTTAGLAAILILTALIIAAPGDARADEVWLQGALYEFDDPVARQFYRYAYGGELSYLWENDSPLDLLTGARVLYSKERYKRREHELIFSSLAVTGLYRVRTDHWLRPHIGAGMAAHYKQDNNLSLATSTGLRTYGHHYLFGLTAGFNNRWAFVANLVNQRVWVDLIEDVNFGGWMTQLGVSYRFGDQQATPDERRPDISATYAD